MKSKLFDNMTLDAKKEMERLQKEIANLSDDQEFTADQLEDLEEVRHAATALAREIEWLFEAFQGKK